MLGPRRTTGWYVLLDGEVVVVDPLYRDCEVRIGILGIDVFWVCFYIPFGRPNSIPWKPPPLTYLPRDAPGCFRACNPFQRDTHYQEVVKQYDLTGTNTSSMYQDRW
jgi:hypothetical protein